MNVLILAVAMALTPVAAIAGTHMTQAGQGGGLPADPDHWTVDGKVTAAQVIGRVTVGNTITTPGDADNTWVRGPIQQGDRLVFLCFEMLMEWFGLRSPFGK